MRYSQLRAFHAVAQHGGFSVAANALGQTQPALSDQVRRLEQAHDVLLFHRDNRRVRLTRQGEELFALTKRFFECEDGIATYLQSSSANIRGALRIVADAVQHLTPALSHFRGTNPNVHVSVQTGNSRTVLDKLRRYDAEIGVVGQLDPGSDLEIVDLGETPIVAVVSRDGPYAGLDKIDFAEIRHFPIIMREVGSRTRASLEAEALKRNIRLKATMDVEGREAMREVVAAGAGVGFVSQAEFGNDNRLRQVRISDFDLTMPEAVVFMKSRRDVPVIRAIRRSISAIRDVE